jgi:hypothetical protein
MNARQQKVDFAINAVRNSTRISNVKRLSTPLLIAFIVESEDILPGSARRMKRVFIRKVDRVLDVVLCGIPSKTARKETRIIKLELEHTKIPNNFDHYYLFPN